MLRTFRAAGAAGVLLAGTWAPLAAQAQPAGEPLPSHRALLDRYCVSCHNERLGTAGLLLDQADLADVGAAAELWEKVVRKLRAGMMPPAGRPRPDPVRRGGLVSWLEAELDQAAARDPQPGRVDGLRRLSRSEYRNAIRDLLALEVDAVDLLPADDSSGGFRQCKPGRAGSGTVGSVSTRGAEGQPSGRRGRSASYVEYGRRTIGSHAGPPHRRFAVWYAGRCAGAPCFSSGCRVRDRYHPRPGFFSNSDT